MKVNFKFFMIILSILLTILCCEKSNVPLSSVQDIERSFKIPNDSVWIPLSQIDSKIFIKVHEEYRPDNRRVQMFCFTEKIYSPAGSRILSDFFQSGDTIKIEFNSIKLSDWGAAIFAPARVDFNLGYISSGSLIFEFKINGKLVLAELRISDTSLDLIIQPNNLIETQLPRVMRVPINTIWGSAESIIAAPAQEFIDSLQILGAKPIRLDVGDYSYFSIDDQGALNLKMVPGMANYNFYLYDFERDTSITRGLVKRFAKRHMDSIYIVLWGGRGEAYFSTVLVNEP